MGKIAILFAGQGAQAVGMGHDLYNNNDEARRVFEMGESIRPGTKAMCFEGPQEALTQTVNTQPCLFLTDLACAYALKKAGIIPDAVAGFSLGEIPALAYSHVLTDEEAFKLVCIRGSVMDECAGKHPGSMVAALKLPNETIEDICKSFNNVYPVNYNCPGQLSCAGDITELDDFVNAVKAAGGRAVKLSVSGAFHTPFMSEATEALAKALNNMNVSKPDTVLYSNLLGDIYPNDRASVIDTISKQASNSVKWEQTIRKMADSGIDTFIEVGCGQTLSGLVKKTLPEANVYSICDSATLSAAIEALK